METNILMFSYLGLVSEFLVFPAGNQSLLYLFICHSCFWMPTNILFLCLLFTKKEIQILEV